MTESGFWNRDKHVLWSKYIDAEVQRRLNLKTSPLSYDRRVQLVCGLFANTIGHSRAITLLIEERHDGSALALVRPCFDAFVRALWLMWCATDDEILEIGPTENEQDDFPPPNKMINAIKKREVGIRELKTIKQMGWVEWNSYTHGGWKQIRGQLSTEGFLSPTYDPDEVGAALVYSDHWYLHIAVLLAEAADNVSLTQDFYALFDKYTEFVIGCHRTN